MVRINMKNLTFEAKVQFGNEILSNKISFYHLSFTILPFVLYGGETSRVLYKLQVGISHPA